jgi:hypothetical protein
MNRDYFKEKLQRALARSAQQIELTANYHVAIWKNAAHMRSGL